MERCIKGMTADITERAAAVLPPATPFGGHIFGAVLGALDRTLPELPVKRVGYLWGPDRPRGGFHKPGTTGPVRPGDDLANITDHSRIGPFLDPAHAIEGVPLIAHLGMHLVLVSCFAEGPNLPDVVRQRLLHKDVFATFHGIHCRGKMSVIRRGNQHGINLLSMLVE
jgi:hypothetical protein